MPAQELLFGEVPLLLLLSVLSIISGIGIVVVSFMFLQQRRLAQLRNQNDMLLARLQQHDTELSQHLPENKGIFTPAEATNFIRWVIGHKVISGVSFIRKKSEESLNGLEEHETVIREKQRLIRAKSEELLRLMANVSGLLSYEKADSTREHVSLRRIGEEVMIELFPYSEAKGVDLKSKWADLEPISVNRDYVTQILTNVILNAIKYSKPGGVVEVTLDLRVEEETQHKTAMVLVRDWGKGIREQDQAKIFDLGTRSDGLTVSGSGIGLHYAQTLARWHGGDVELVDSVVNQGSTFMITLPYS